MEYVAYYRMDELGDLIRVPLEDGTNAYVTKNEKGQVTSMICCPRIPHIAPHDLSAEDKDKWYEENGTFHLDTWKTELDMAEDATILQMYKGPEPTEPEGIIICPYVPVVRPQNIKTEAQLAEWYKEMGIDPSKAKPLNNPLIFDDDGSCLY